ncbi:uncharacterized protein LOC134751872 isoform X1 [Cydia strobilella]|uniref:uncharacterized protein LOC134751872 isoform X1 n=1 Tax=Cydia strobilella TaxID=1100964 RepID=UPI0030046BCB
MDLDEPNKLLNSDLSSVNILNYQLEKPKADNDGVPTSYRVELTTKRAVELLLAGTLRNKVCRYCLSVASPLSDLDQIMQIAGKGMLYKVTIRDMVAYFHPFKTLNDPNFPRKICNKCLNRCISAYLFSQQCEQSERALRNCFEDMYAKLEKLDPLDKTKKRGRQKLNPNYNVLHTDHAKVIDYAEPIRNIVNVRSVSLSHEPYMSDLECPKCWQIFTKIENLIIHEKSHPSNMWFNCRLCGKSFVKRLQLKRHLKSHVGPEIKPEEKDNFQCGTCGAGSEDLSAHLQHIEKHKFQSVLQHLVEKKMDKLCTVCLDKKPKLVELDKMIRLHGGYPGVTGDKSLYSILGSTLPDRKSYKYQELYVPHHAKIMKFAKLTKDKAHNETLVKSGCNTNQIVISNPLIISNDKFDCEKMYLFFFSDPSADNNFGKEIAVDKNNWGESITGYDKDEDLYASLESKGETYNDVELLPEEIGKDNEKILTNNDALSNQSDVIESTGLNQSKNIAKTTGSETACNICWIFKKPTCKICIDKQSNTEGKTTDEEIKEATDDSKNKCKYCWIFKTSDKCGVCKNLTNTRNTTNVTKEEEETKDTEDTNLDLQRKRKLNENETISKNKKWNCQICLTSNVEKRFKCICCESNRNNQDDMLKVNLDGQHAFKIFKSDDELWNHKELDLTIFNTSEANESDRKAQVTPMDNTVNTIDFEIAHSINEDTFKIFDFENLTYRKNIQDPEEMDIAEDDPQIIIPNPNPFSFNITPHFSNIAAQTSDTTQTSNIFAQLNNLEQASNVFSDSEDDPQIIIPNPNPLSFNITPHFSNIAAQTSDTTQTSNVFAQLNNLEQASNVFSDSELKFNMGTGPSKTTGQRRIMRPIRRMAYHK